MDWINTVNGLITLIFGLISLSGAVVSAIVAMVKLFKGKKAKEVWALVMEMADAAMKEAEASGKKGADKKEMVMEAVKAGCKAAGINIDGLVDQLADYIDQTIKFVNDMKSPKKLETK